MISANGEEPPPKERSYILAERITRKFLTALGVPEAAQDAIIDAYREAIDPVLEENKGLKKQVEAIDTSHDWKSEAEKAKSELEAYRADVAAKDAKRAKEAAYRAILAEAGIADKRIDSVLRISGSTIEGLELGKDGAVKNRAELVAAAKTEWADFIPTTVTVGSQIPHPPANTGKTPTMTRAEIESIKDGTERRKAIAENPELFGI